MSFSVAFSRVCSPVDFQTSSPPSAFRASLDALLQREARPADKYGHQPRLYALTRQVGQGFTYDDDVVFAAAYLHDLGVFIGHRPENLQLLQAWDHVHYAGQRAPELLQRAGFPVHKIDAVIRTIETHQPKDDPDTIEGFILRDADILEQLGAVGVLRAVAKTGRDTRYPSFTPVVAALERALRELPDAIRLPGTRLLAAPRVETLRLFLAAVREEAGDALF